MKYWFQQKLKEIKGSLVGFTLKSGIIVITGILILDVVTYIMEGSFDFEGVLVEAHGMIFDVIFFGIIIAYFNYKLEKKRDLERDEDLARREKERKEDLDRRESEQKAELVRREKERKDLEYRNRIDRYLEELDDYRGWKSDEAGYRVGGLIRRLQNNDIAFDSEKLHLGKAPKELIVKAVRESKYPVSLKEADLKNVDLSRAHLWKLDLSHSTLNRANLKSANLKMSILNNSTMGGSDLRETKLHRAEMLGTTIDDVKVDSQNWIKKLQEWRVKGALGLAKKYEISNKEHTDNNGDKYFLVVRKHDESGEPLYSHEVPPEEE